MIAATRRWLRRNRTPLVVGAGLVGVTYLAGQYVISKIVETRERMSADRIARENLRRRFQQNQEDCTFTVLALLPTAAENILDALPVEQIAEELQQQKAERLGRSGASDGASTGLPSSGSPSVTEEDGSKSMLSFQAESFIHTSQMGDSRVGNGGSELPKQPKTKRQLWAELKISSITRAFTLLYTLAFLTLLTRIQLNLLGRRNYLSSVVHLASRASHDSTIRLENRDDDRAEMSYGNDFETNRRFLTFSWWLLHRGWREIMQQVEEAVKEVFGPLSPREEITLERLSELVVEVRKKIEGSTEDQRRTRKWLPYLLPPRDKEAFVLQESGMMPLPSDSSPAAADPSSSLTSNFPIPSTTATNLSTDPLRRLLDETADLIDSPTATHLLTLLLDVLFSQLIDTVLRTQAFDLDHSAAQSSRIQDLSSPPSDFSINTQAKAKMATILAIISRQAHAIGSGVPNDYVQAVEDVREIEAFAAVVYSCNWEFEGLDPAPREASDAHDHEQQAPKTTGAGVDVVEAVRDGGTEVARGAWGMFEGVWGAIVGSGQASMVA